MMDTDKLFESFVSFLTKRETPLSSNVDREAARKVFNCYLMPMLDKMSPSHNELNLKKDEMIKFAGELFSLSMYAKIVNIDNWIPNPHLPNGKTPDFSINNGSKYIEIYSPAQNNKNPNLDFYLNKKRNSIRREIEDKSKKYTDLNLVLVIHIIVNEFVEDIKTSLEKAQIHENHFICFILGDTHIPINSMCTTKIQ